MSALHSAHTVSTPGERQRPSGPDSTPLRAAPRGSRAALSAALGALLLAGCVVAPVRHRAPPPPAPPAPQQTMYFYPELSQSENKQDRDRYECYRWAVRQTGVDPGMTPVRDVPPPVPRAAVRDGSEVVAGGAIGAITGAAVSGPRHVGQSMVLGAVFGSLIGAAAQEARVQHAEQAYERRLANQQARQQVPLDNFHRAMGACMEGRGYRIG
ncbi:MAG: glycine zipper family protein [Ideonella sp.]|nr:glycine zipper family protein [Ideonella sp.]MCC7455686.1 hypothetical protein [Nitrospira sp.]